MTVSSRVGLGLDPSTVANESVSEPSQIHDTSAGLSRQGLSLKKPTLTMNNKPTKS